MLKYLILMLRCFLYCGGELTKGIKKSVVTCVEILENFARGPKLQVFHFPTTLRSGTGNPSAPSAVSLKINSHPSVSVHPTVAKNKVSTNKT